MDCNLGYNLGYNLDNLDYNLDYNLAEEKERKRGRSRRPEQGVGARAICSDLILSPFPPNRVDWGGV